MRPVLFIDRDGTIVHEPEDEAVNKIEKITFLPQVLHYLKKVQSESDYYLVMVSNQDGLGNTEFPESDFYPLHNYPLF